MHFAPTITGAICPCVNNFQDMSLSVFEQETTGCHVEAVKGREKCPYL